MAAPTPTARTTPPGIPLRDGHPTKITIAADVNIDFWEKSIQPPGIDGGDPINMTTFFNTTWRVMRPRTLATLTEVSLTALYDPIVYDQIVAIINQETTITITFNDGSTVAFFGFLQTFEPQEVEDGEAPEAEITIQPTNWDASNSVEAGPAVSSVAGT